nr:protein spinster homolog 1-like [Aotus nancymaae]
MLGSAIFICLIFVAAKSSIVGAYICIFVGETLLFSNWAITADILMVSQAGQGHLVQLTQASTSQGRLGRVEELVAGGQEGRPPRKVKPKAGRGSEFWVCV